MRRSVIKNIFFVLMLFCSFPSAGQQYLLSDSKLTFYSEAPVEDIEATTTKTRSLFNAQTGEIAFVIPVKTFVFDKKLMQQHFNEDYLETHKYPEATFKGKLTAYDPSKRGPQKAVAEGEMNIHGVTRTVEAEGIVEFKENEMTLVARFPIRVADYKVDIPKVVFYNIAEVVDITLNGNYKLHEKD